MYVCILQLLLAMGRCLHCAHADYCRRHWRYQLVERDALHPIMWLNPHIHTRYRPERMPWVMCARSALFDLNNETLNVWSHLLGFFYIGAMQYWCAYLALPRVGAPSIDYVVMAGSMTCSQICLVLSAAYHMFGCHSVERRSLWLKADLFGVSLALIGIYLSGIYTSFYRFPEIQKLYGACMSVILSISLSIPLLSSNECSRHLKKSERLKKRASSDKCLSGDGSHHSKPNERRIGLTHLIYIALVAFGLYPTWHWIELHGGLYNPHVMQWLPTLIVLFSLIGLAFIFYATLIPERFFPGKFDIVGCSHQWWHILILVAMIYWHNASVDLLIFYHTSPFKADWQENFETLMSGIRSNVTIFN